MTSRNELSIKKNHAYLRLLLAWLNGQNLDSNFVIIFGNQAPIQDL